MFLLRCFCTAVPPRCRVLETGGECTELVMRLGFMVVHTAVCLVGPLPQVMVKTCVCVCVCLLAFPKPVSLAGLNGE